MGNVKVSDKILLSRENSTGFPIFCILSHSTISYFSHKAPSKEGNRGNCSGAGKNMVTCKSRINFPEFLWKKCDHHLKLYPNPSAEQGDQVFRDSSFTSATSLLFQQGNSQLLPVKCFFHGIPTGRFLHFHGFLFFN